LIVWSVEGRRSANGGTNLKENRSISSSLLVLALSLLLLTGTPRALFPQTDGTSSVSSVTPSLKTADVTAPPIVGTAEPVLESPQDPQGGKPANKKSDWDKGPDAWKFILYPAYVWVPFFSTSMTLPEIPSPPGGGGPVTPHGTTSGSFDGAAFAGAEIDKSKWSGVVTFLYAGLSATKTVPKARLSMDFYYGQAMLEREVYKGLHFGGGFRRMALDLTATVGSYPSVGRSPGFWDPLLSATYRKQFSKKWRVNGHMDGGGFGVGSDVDIGASASADWRFAKHFGISMGGAYLYFENTNTVLRKSLTIKPKMYGPTFGFGIYF